MVSQREIIAKLIMKITSSLIVCLLIAESFVSAAPAANDDCVCGGEVIKSRIKNGQEVKGYKYPWMAQIKSYNDRDEGEYFQCGGSLIDDRTVVSAAHCFQKEDGSFIQPEDIDIYLGRKSFVDDDEEDAYQVEKLWVDPDYDNESLSNDFAIITLSETVKFGRRVSPICLPNTANGLEQFKVAGWGRKGKHGGTSSKLLEAAVNLVPRDKCYQALIDWLNKTDAEELKSPDFNSTELIPETHMCANNYLTGGDACSGDSGGPLMYLGQGDRWFLVGVVSGSWEECGVDKNGASLYTKLNYYQETIKTQAPSACWRDP